CLSIPGAREMLSVAASVTSALGEDSHAPLSTLDACYGNDSLGLASHVWVEKVEGPSIRADERTLGNRIVAAQAACRGRLHERDSKHVDVQRSRAALATSTISDVADVLTELALDVQSATGVSGIAFGGAAFEAVGLRSKVACRLPAAIFAPVAQPIGAALGAALLPFESVESIGHVALGRGFSDQEIKAALDNCRLDYVYEPDWAKLLTRTSDLLTSGAT